MGNLKSIGCFHLRSYHQPRCNKEIINKRRIIALINQAVTATQSVGTISSQTQLTRITHFTIKSRFPPISTLSQRITTDYQSFKSKTTPNKRSSSNNSIWIHWCWLLRMTLYSLKTIQTWKASIAAANQTIMMRLLGGSLKWSFWTICT